MALKSPKDMTPNQFRQYIYNLEREATDKLAKRDLNTEKFLESVYQTATNRIQDQMDDFYLKYAAREGISPKEARKRASQMDITKYLKKAEKAVRERDFSPEANEWLRVYNLKMKTSRLEVMKAEINLELLKMYSEIDTAEQIELYKLGIEEAQRQAGILGDSAKNAPKRLQALVDADFYGAEFSKRIWGASGHYEKTRQEVFRAIGNMHVDMAGYRKARDELVERMGVSKSHAMRLVRTEERRIISDTQMRMYKANDFSHYIYVIEVGACDDCKKLENKIFAVKDAQMGVTMAPKHPNCRCSHFAYNPVQRLVNGVWVDEVPEKI